MSQNVFQSLERVLLRIDEIKRRFGINSSSTGKSFGSILEEETTKVEETRGPEQEARTDAVSADREQYGDVITAASEQFKIPEPLIRAVIKQESGFKENAVSKKGALGLMQLMPATADLLGVEDPFDVEENILGGVQYLRQMIDLYGGNLNKALAAYNAGPNRVNESIPEIPETVSYIRSVLDYYNQFSKTKESEGL
jgi:soluble lytic murein transglycosylase-like protein